MKFGSLHQRTQPSKYQKILGSLVNTSQTFQMVGWRVLLGSRKLNQSELGYTRFGRHRYCCLKFVLFK